MLTISPALVSNVQPPANETAQEAVEHSAMLEPRSTSALPLNGIVPDGGLHVVAQAATAPQSTNDLQQMLQQLLGQLQGNVGGTSTTPKDLHPVAQAQTGLASKGADPLMQALLGQLGNKLNVGGATTSTNDPHPVSNATAQDPTSRLMTLLAQIMADLTKQ